MMLHAIAFYLPVMILAQLMFKCSKKKSAATGKSQAAASQPYSKRSASTMDTLQAAQTAIKVEKTQQKVEEGEKGGDKTLGKQNAEKLSEEPLQKKKDRPKVHSSKALPGDALPGKSTDSFTTGGNPDIAGADDGYENIDGITDEQLAEIAANTASK